MEHHSTWLIRSVFKNAHVIGVWLSMSANDGHIISLYHCIQATISMFNVLLAYLIFGQIKKL